MKHIPVLLEEVVTHLVLKPDGIYIDATYGRGGHSQAILNRLHAQGRLLAIDRDPLAVSDAEQRFKNDARFSIVAASFGEISQIAKQNGIWGRVDGILMDLGMSSPQLDDPQRGFSFLNDGPLDMRMDTTQGLTAAEWLAFVAESELADVFKTYGEERFAKRIARAIVAARLIAPITTTGQLAAIIAKTQPRWEAHKHPATRCFQAIRIFINKELQALQTCLEGSLSVLVKGGRLAVISFHSLEDRIVKRFMREESRGQVIPREIPIKEQPSGQLKVIGGVIKPTAREVKENPRARSAILRIAEKIL